MGIYKKNPVLSITSSGEIGFWEHDIEASKMQGRARGRKGERKTYHINPYHHGIWRIFIECGKKKTRAQERARAKRKGSYPTKKQQEFSTTPIYTYISWRLPRPWITAGKSFVPFFWGNQFFEPSLFIVALFLGRTWKDPIHTKLHGTQVRQGAMGRSEEGRCGSLAVRPWDQRIGTCLCVFFSGQI